MTSSTMRKVPLASACILHPTHLSPHPAARRLDAAQLTVADVARVCRGNMVFVWNFLLDNVLPEHRVKHVVSNLRMSVAASPI
jgi:hypothetical protein